LQTDSVTYGDTAADNYVGVDWQFNIDGTAIQTGGKAGQPGFRTNTGASSFGKIYQADYSVFVTVRLKGQPICNDSINFSTDALNYSGKVYTLCGQPAVFDEAQNRAYYRVPGVIDAWVDSPEVCTNPGGYLFPFLAGANCHHYWYHDWGNQPVFRKQPPKTPPTPVCPKPVPGRPSFCP
jgi:hypothetical protein